MAVAEVEVRVVVADPQRRRVGQAREVWRAIKAAAIPHQLVDEGQPAAAPMHDHVLQLDEPGEMHADLPVRPADPLADLATTEAHVTRLHARFHGAIAHELVQGDEHPAGLR